MDSSDETFFKLFPVIKWIKDYYIIEKKLGELLHKKYELKQTGLIYDDLFDNLVNLNKKELKRKETIEDKGKSILLILTLTGTILIGTMKVLFGSIVNLDWIIIILFLGIFYLIVSIALILSVINATMFSDLNLDDSYKIKKNNISNNNENNNITSQLINIESIGKNKQIGELIRSIELNQLTLQRKANDLSCGLSTLRRSFILFFIFLCVTYINKCFPIFFIIMGKVIIYFFESCGNEYFWIMLFIILY